MNRRKFLVGTAAGAAGLAGLSRTGWAQGRQTVPGPPAAGRGRGPADVPAAKLARVSLMTLNFNSYRIPNNGTPTNPDQTMTVFDLPKMYVDMYGVHNIEFQIDDIRKSETDPNFIKEMKAKLDENKMTMTQVNMEFGMGQFISNPDAAMRKAALDHLKQWIDIANQYGCKRLMLNQNQAMLNKDTRAGAVETMKAMADAARPSGIKISVETRGVVGATAAELGMKPWEFMIGIIKDAGANSNVDIGNVAAANQQELHDCIKAWFPYSSGNMHIKSSPNWDIGTAIRFTEGLGYKGLYSIEVGRHEGIRIVYNTILANIA